MSDSICRKSMLHLCRLTKKYSMTYTKHHLKFGKNQADNLEYMGFRRRFFPVFYWCLLLISKRRTAIHISSVLNARRLAPHVYLPRIVVSNIKNKRNSHFIGLQTDLSRSVLLFECELRCLTYRYFAIASILVLLA